MTHPNRARLSKLSLGLLMALAAAPAFAQTTSASLGGRITGADSQPVAGAQVTIVHTPSGTVSNATTDASGRYAARGLRVGGPYTITITRDGRTETRNDVFLGLTEANNVDAQVGSGPVADATNLGAVTVTASREISVFSPDKSGAGTIYTREQIESAPSINRTIQDVVKLDPRVVQTDKARNEISVGGQNTRYNAIRVDGISTNDAFGLESNGLPTPRQPFSQETLDSISIDVANYDVSSSGGAGGVINAVTKSGTNDFHGSVYGIYRDNSLVRENTDGSDFTGFEDEQTYGLTVGGPLIKDKLFFFFNYEKFRQTAPGPTFGPIGSGASNIVNVTPTEIARIQDIALNKYGFDAGSENGAGNANTDSEEYGLKIDWNINDSQRASFRYGKSDQSVAIFPGFGSTTIALGSYAYQRDFKFETYVAQLYSDWTDNFSTEAKVSYRDYSAVRTPVSNLPSIRINYRNPIVGTTDARNASVFLGTEENTHVNVLETTTYNAFLAGTYYAGDHQIKFGGDYEDNDVFNLFGRRSNGTYIFNSVDAFESGLSDSYRYYYPAGGVRANAAATFKLKNLGLFLQDTWSVNDNLTINYGVRFDSPIIDDKPQYNAAAEAAFGFDNSKTIDGNNLVAPRFGFNYTFDGDLKSQLRGGVGLFQGAAANVWISNAYSNTGFGYTDYNYTSGSATIPGRPGVPARPGVGPFTPDPDNQLSIIPAGALTGTQSIDFIDPDLGQPAVYKANLAFDQELPVAGIVASAELVVTQVKEAIYYQQLNLGASTGVGQDGRVLYYNPAGYNRANFNAAGTASSSAGVRSRFNQSSAFSDAIIARPTSKGHGEQLTLSLEKPFGQSDWSWLASYTFTNATEVSPLTSSTSFSNYANNAVFQANENVSATSNYEIHDRFLGVLNWKHAFFGDSQTRVSLVYEGRTGKPYSFVFDNDANGDGVGGNDLLYIPNGPGDVIFGSATEEAAYFAFANGDKYLSTHGGQVAERNAANSTWVNQFDLSFAQEIPGFFGDDKFELTLDVLNIGNLINKKWGQIEEVGFPLTRGVVEYGGIDPTTGKYVYRFNTPDPLSIYDDQAVSRWQVQVGVRYQF